MRGPVPPAPLQHGVRAPGIWAAFGCLDAGSVVPFLNFALCEAWPV